MAKSIKDRLAEKASKVKPSAAAAKKKEEIVHIEDPVLADAADRMSAAIYAKKIVDGKAEAARAVVLPALQRELYSRWVTNGVRGPNPKVHSTSATFTLQCKDSLSRFKLPAKEDGEMMSVEEYLDRHKIPELIARRMQEDFQTTSEMSINMTALEKESPALAEKLMSVILAACEEGVTLSDGSTVKFTDDEASKMLVQVSKVEVKSGFLDRAIQYVRESIGRGSEMSAVDNLERIFSAVPPTWAVSQVSVTHPEAILSRMILEEDNKEEQLLVPATQDFSIRDDFTAKVMGNLVTVFRGDKRIGDKECEDHDHALNTVKKWIKTPAAFDKFVVESLK